MKTVILQSQRADGISSWMRVCLDSVADWAERTGADYRLLGDDLFDCLPDWVLPKVGSQKVIATDLARLRLMLRCLGEGYQRALWLDADTLIFAPERLQTGAAGQLVGREVWVQSKGPALQTYRKVHNAYLLARRGDSFLPFYADCAESLLRRARGPLVPQFIGPKLLTALHNVVGLQVEERAGMLSPLALRDLIGSGGGRALRRTLAGHAHRLAAVNLSASLCGRDVDGINNDEAAYQLAVERLLRDGL